MNELNPFHSLKNSQGFIPFFVLGDPSIKESLELIKVAIDTGADALELGLPFSDPMADGPIIQRANQRALRHSTFEKALHLLKQIRDYSPIPINILTYANPLYNQGFEKAIIQLKQAGVDGILIADVPLEENKILSSLLNHHQLRQSFLIAPNTSLERAKIIHQNSTAFTYLINRLGTTGLQDGVSNEIMVLLKDLTNENLIAKDVPKVIGFGIHTPQQAIQLFSAGADAIIVGSKIVQFIETENNQSNRILAIQRYIKHFKKEIQS